MAESPIKCSQKADFWKPWSEVILTPWCQGFLGSSHLKEIIRKEKKKLVAIVKKDDLQD